MCAKYVFERLKKNNNCDPWGEETFFCNDVMNFEWGSYLELFSNSAKQMRQKLLPMERFSFLVKHS